MKNLIFTISFLIIISSNLFADKIYTTSNNVIKGKVIDITSTGIEYDPEGPVPFKIIKKSKVKKIVYNNGKAVIINKNLQHKENDDYQKNLERKKEAAKNSFRHSIIRVGVFGAWGFAGGSIYEKEDRIARENGQDDDYDLGGYGYYGGIEVDFMLPSSSAFKVGIKGRYLFVSDDTEEYDGKYDELYTFNGWQIGPSVNVMLLEKRIFNIALNFYTLYGRILNGDLDAVPHLRGQNIVSLNKSEYHTTFTGYTVSTGIGPQFIFTGPFPAIIGVNLNYTFAKFNFDKELPVYGSDHTALDLFSIEFTAGLHF